MSKKMILAGSAMVLMFAAAMPVYAQSTTPEVNQATPQVNQGFMGEIATFFNSFFHHQMGANGANGQTQTQSGPNQPAPSGQTSPSGSMQPTPSGMPDYTSMQQRRLSYLVQQGKITQAQETAIMTELTSVQTELKTWAQTQGINPDYVLGGGGGFGGQRGGFQTGMNQSQGTSGSQGGNPQYQHPMMQGGQGPQGGNQQGGQNGQPPQQGQGQ
jgi:hypothetical protein